MKLADPAFEYDAFISYSRTDREFAVRIQNTLERRFLRLSKKIRRNKKKLELIRDETDFDLNPDLWEEIRAKIKRSRKLILIVSEKSAFSPWVKKEIEAYRESHSGNHPNEGIIPLLYQAPEDNLDIAFPSILIIKGTLPRAIEFRRNLIEQDINFSDYLRVEGCERVFAGLLDVPYRELTDRQGVYLRRLRRRNNAIGVALIVIFAGLALTAWLQSNRYKNQLYISESLRLSNIATDYQQQDSTKAIRIAELAYANAKEFSPNEVLGSLLDVYYNGMRNRIPFYQTVVSLDMDEITTAVDLNQYGLMAISIDKEGTEQYHVQAWSLRDYVQIANFIPEGGLPNALKLVDKGKKLLVGGQDGGVRAISLNNNEIQEIFTAFDDAICDIVVDSREQRVAISDFSGDVRVYDFDGGKAIWKSSLSHGSCPRLAMSGDGQVLWIAGDIIRRLVIDSGNFDTEKDPNSYILALQTTEKGERLLMGTDKLEFWLSFTEEEQQTYSKHEEDVVSVAFSAKQDLLLSGSRDGTARLWDVANGETISLFPGHKNQEVSLVGFVNEENDVVTVGNTDVKLWHYVRSEVVSFVKHNCSELGYCGVNALSYSNDGKQLLTAGDDGAVRLWNSNSGKLLATYNGISNSVEGVQFSPRGKQAISWGDIKEGRALLRQASMGKPIEDLHIDVHAATFATISPDAELMLLVDINKHLFLQSLKADEHTRVPACYDSSPTLMAFSRSGDEFSVGCENGNVEVFTTMGLKRCGGFAFNFNEDAVWFSYLGYSRDDESIIVARGHALSSALEIHDRGDFRMRVSIPLPEKSITAVDLSPDGRWIIAGVSDPFEETDLIIFWSTEDGEEITRISGLAQDIRSLSVSPNGLYYAIAEGSGRVRQHLSAAGIYLWLQSKDIYHLTDADRNKLRINTE